MLIMMIEIIAIIIPLAGAAALLCGDPGNPEGGRKGLAA